MFLIHKMHFIWMPKLKFEMSHLNFQIFFFLKRNLKEIDKVTFNFSYAKCGLHLFDIICHIYLGFWNGENLGFQQSLNKYADQNMQVEKIKKPKYKNFFSYIYIDTFHVTVEVFMGDTYNYARMHTWLDLTSSSKASFCQMPHLNWIQKMWLRNFESYILHITVLATVSCSICIYTNNIYMQQIAHKDCGTIFTNVDKKACTR